MQAMLAQTVSKFQFDFSEETKDIIRWPGFSTSPRLAGRGEQGVQMPLRVTPIQ